MEKLSGDSPYWWRRDLTTDIDLYGPPVSGGHEDCRHRRYGLSCRQFEQLLRRSGNQCEICGLPAVENVRGKLFIDHDHEIGQWAVRGLLCLPCNHRLTRPDFVSTHADYLANAWHFSAAQAPCPHATPDFTAWPNARLRTPEAYRASFDRPHLQGVRA